MLVKTTIQIWKRDEKITFTAPPSQLAVSGPLNTTTTTSSSKSSSKTTRVFRVDNVPDTTLRFISAPSLSAMRRERLELGGDEEDEEEKKKKILELRINEAGSTAAQTRHRFGASLTPDLLRFSASGGISSLKKWVNLPKKDHAKSNWGESKSIIPSRPQCEYTTKQTRVAKTNSKTKQKRVVDVIKVEPVFDGVKMNEYETKLRAIPNVFSVNVDSEAKCVDVAVRPYVLAHRAAASLLRGRKDCGVRLSFISLSFSFYTTTTTTTTIEPQVKGSEISVKWRISEPHKEDLGSDSRDVRETFEVPTSDDYKEANTPDAFVGVDPVTKKRYELYPRQRRALGRMLQAEKGDIVFEEREWEQVDFKAVGIVAEAEATRKAPCRGGVLADVMGGGKTATSIALVATGRDTARARPKTPHFSSATLVLVPTNLTSSWSTYSRTQTHSYRITVSLKKNAT